MYLPHLDPCLPHSSSMNTCSVNKTPASHGLCLSRVSAAFLSTILKYHTTLEKAQRSSRMLTKPLKIEDAHFSFLQLWQGEGPRFLL